MNHPAILLLVVVLAAVGVVLLAEAVGLVNFAAAVAVAAGGWLAIRAHRRFSPTPSPR